MSIRDALNKNRNLTSAIMIVLIVLTLGYTFWYLNSSGAPSITAKSWYTVDEGKTWFADGIYKSTPFEKDGKQAYGAAVFKCGDGEPFVPFVTRLGDRFLAEARKLEASGDEAFGPKFEALQTQGLEVRKIGTDKWVLVNSPAGERIVSEGLRCPDNSNVSPVMP